MDAGLPTVRDRIVAAGLELLEEAGLAGLTQPKVAARSGLRQSHLTYYFPRIGDLLLAVLLESHRLAGSSGDALEDIRRLLFDRRRMAFFLRVMAELGDRNADGEGGVHLETLNGALARRFRCDAQDEVLAAFIDQLRGRALRHLVTPDHPEPNLAELEEMARRLGLTRPA